MESKFIPIKHLEMKGEIYREKEKGRASHNSHGHMECKLETDISQLIPVNAFSLRRTFTSSGTQSTHVTALRVQLSSGFVKFDTHDTHESNQTGSRRGWPHPSLSKHPYLPFSACFGIPSCICKHDPLLQPLPSIRVTTNKHEHPSKHTLSQILCLFTL